MCEHLFTKAKKTLEAMTFSRHQDVSDVRVMAGVYNFNCSGFIGWLLRDHLAAYLEFWPESGERPYVKDYCDSIDRMRHESLNYWEPLKTVWEIKPGDIVTWRRPSAYGDRYPSGHVMIAADKAYPSHRKGEALLTVIDSTKQPHSDDSRETTARTGLGYGTVGIGIDADGVPKSYFWRGGLSTNEIITWVGMARLKRPPNF